MDYFALFLDGICLLGQGVMHILFVSRLTGKKLKPLHFTVYILLLTALQLHFLDVLFDTVKFIRHSQNSFPMDFS